jgi:hypothetical protein
LPALRLLYEIRVSTTAGDKLLDMLNLFLLFVILLHLLNLVFAACLNESIVISVVHLKCPQRSEVHNICANAIQEVLRM